MTDRDSLAPLVDELRTFAQTAASRGHLEAPDLRRVLGFVVKVAQVAEQAFQDVLVVLTDLKYLTPSDLASGRIMELQKQVDLLTARSRFRDAEEICSRLHHLGDSYRTQIDPLLHGVVDRSGWRGMFGLIDEHEGRLINLIHEMSYELERRLRSLDAQSLPTFTKFANEQARNLRSTIDQLRALTNKILGLSGEQGLLELTERGDRRSTEAHVLIEKGALHMSRDTYNVGQAGAVGPGATAQQFSMQQVWQQNAERFNLADLARELDALRSAMRGDASDAEHDVAIGAVAAAEAAAKQGDGPAALAKLKEAGKWAFDVATKIGVTVAAAALKTALGI